MDSFVEQQFRLLTTSPNYKEEEDNIMMFYLTLPSNSSLQFYPDNTLTNFTTQLAHAVDLTGAWEVGLAEIQYPHTWHNVHQEDGWIQVTNNHGQKGKMILPPGQYDTPEELIGGLNEMIEKRHYYNHAYKKMEVEAVPTNTKPMEFSYHGITKKATIRIKRNCRITMSEMLTSMLGMQSRHMSAGTHKGTNVVDVNQGFHSLYVYCNVVEARPVGDCEVPLLRIVPVEGKSGQIITKTYENIQYIPVLQKHFRTVEIDIKKDTGESVPFELGKLVVTLHFRKRRPIL